MVWRTRSKVQNYGPSYRRAEGILGQTLQDVKHANALPDHIIPSINHFSLEHSNHGNERLARTARSFLRPPGRPHGVAVLVHRRHGGFCVEKNANLQLGSGRTVFSGRTDRRTDAGRTDGRPAKSTIFESSPKVRRDLGSSSWGPRLSGNSLERQVRTPQI